MSTRQVVARLAGILLVTALIGTTGVAGTATAAEPTKSQKVSLLFALTAARGTLAPVEGTTRQYELTLRGTSDHTTWFADRPVRASGFLTTGGFVSDWSGFGFDDDPPNVALLVEGKTGVTDTIVAVMTHPTVASTGVFTARLRLLSIDQAQALGGNLTIHAGRHDLRVLPRFGAAALFIDDAGCADWSPVADPDTDPDWWYC